LNIETQFHKRKQPLILEKCAFSPEAILWACLMLSSKFLESTQKQLTLKTACHLPDIPDSQGGLAKAELFVFSLLDHNVDFRPTGFFPFIELFLCNMDDAILQAKIFQIAEQLASLLTIAASEKIFESASSQHIAASVRTIFFPPVHVTGRLKCSYRLYSLRSNCLSLGMTMLQHLGMLFKAVFEIWLLCAYFVIQ